MKKTAVVLALWLLSCGLQAKSLTEIDREIAVAKSRLERNEDREGSLQSRVDKLSKEITFANRQLNYLERNLSASAQEIGALEEGVTKEKSERERLAKERDALILEKEAIEKRLVELLANHLSQSLVLSKDEPGAEEDLVRQELFRAIRDRSTKETALLRDSYEERARQIRNVESRIGEMKNRLDRLVDARARQKELRAEQSKLVDELDKRKGRYLADLNNLIEQKNSERQMLADLRIVRQHTVDSLKQEQLTRKEAQRREAETRVATAKAETGKVRNVEVKQYGTSYQQAGRSDYKGRKVKAPLDDSHPISIIKEFGPYTDPIYNIKIHNDSVTLKTAQNDAVVRSVLPGKVVFADDLRLLGKVVIVEHAGNIHTIYRNLESISPNIRVDRALKERESIGRIAGELVFEVTKNGLPINPLQLIALK